MHEQEMEIRSGDFVLAGTLTVPDTNGKYPAVLMVHGSGPLDRNQNMKGQKLDIFNVIAHVLAENGIASLRYDKRGCGDSSGDYMKAGHADLVTDATHSLEALAGSEWVAKDSLYVLGHSEGCIIAPQLCVHSPALAGLILVCPFIEKLDSVLLRQAAQIEKELDSLRYFSRFFYKVLFWIFGRPSSTQQKLLHKVKATDSAVVRIGLSKFPAKWLREMLALDLNSIFASTHTPMLLIAGEKDLQCDPEDIFRIEKTAQSRCETLVVEGMTHLLRVDENPPILTGYASLIDQPIDRAVIEKIIQWIHQ